MDTYIFVLALFSVFGAYIAQGFVASALRMRKYKLPPRIAGAVPFFGHMFQVPPAQQGPWAKDLAEKYGEMCGLESDKMSLCRKANMTLGSPAILEAQHGYFSILRG